MLTITASVTGTALVASPTAALGLTYTVADSDAFINRGTVTVDWGDGRSEVAVTGALPLGPTTVQHGYSPGTYILAVRATNYRSPRPDTAVFTQTLVVTAATSATLAEIEPVVFGPILPRDDGFPSADVWNHNMANDGVILESSLRMLLLTRRGERIADPNYGSNVGALVFSLNTADLPGVIRDEITRAVSAYEPRVELITCNVVQQGRTVLVTAEFKSLLSRKNLVLNFGFAT